MSEGKKVIEALVAGGQATAKQTSPETKEIVPVKLETLAKWRQWGVPEDIIKRAIKQRTALIQARKVEERITIPHFAYPMPRLPQIEAQTWGFAKVIDTEGWIETRHFRGKDRIRRIDRWLYRLKYYRPRIGIKTTTYQLTEEFANMLNSFVLIHAEWSEKRGRYDISYYTLPVGARVVRVCYLIQPYLTVPKKKKAAKEILRLYKQSPQVPAK